MRTSGSCTRCSLSLSAMGGTSWRMMLIILTVLHPYQEVWAAQEAHVKSSQCSYTLVVNEFDASRCPVMQADALPGQEEGQQQQLGQPRYAWRDPPSPASSHRYPPSSSSAQISGQTKSQFYRMRPRQGPGGPSSFSPSFSASAPSSSSSSSDKEVNVLRSQVKELEGRLLEEMVRTRELNSTLSRHSSALNRAEERLGAYNSNFTAIYRAMVFVQRQLQKQRKINRSLNKKLSNVLLDVVEVNNVLNKSPAGPAGAAGIIVGPGAGAGAGAAAGKKAASAKNFDVQSVSKARSCPGVTDQSTNFRGIPGQPREREKERQRHRQRQRETRRPPETRRKEERPLRTHPDRQVREKQPSRQTRQRETAT